MKRPKKRVFLGLTLTAIALIMVWVAWQFRPPPLPLPLPKRYSPQKAVWLEIDWVTEAHTTAEIEALAKNLQAHDVNYVFAYVSYLKSGNFFNPTFNYAAEFVHHFRQIAPEIKLLAWVGVPIQVTTPDGRHISNRLDNPQIRELIAQFSAQMVSESGFDGVHLNAEMIVDDNAALINTLQVIRINLPPDSILSLAGHALRPTTQITNAPFASGHWSESYLRKVAENVDQLALMAYDSGLFFPSDYRAWVAYQVRTSAEALNGLETELLIGIPASEEWTLSHNITTEYMANALFGVSLELSKTEVAREIAGIAVYPHWEIEPAEWALLDAFHG